MKPAKCRILVEGTIDAIAIRELLARRGVNPAGALPYRVNVIEVGRDTKEGGGITRLFVGVEDEETQRRLGGATGYVADADGSAENRWASIRDRMAAAGVAVPDGTPPGFVAASQKGAWLGAWVMPDNVSPGALETWLLSLAPHERRGLVDHARAATAEAYGIHPHVEGTPGGLREVDRSKAELMAYLAWHRKPSTNFGVSFEAGRLDADSPAAVRFVAWVKELLDRAEA